MKARILKVGTLVLFALVFYCLGASSQTISPSAAPNDPMEEWRGAKLRYIQGCEEVSKIKHNQLKGRN